MDRRPAWTCRPGSGSEDPRVSRVRWIAAGPKDWRMPLALVVQPCGPMVRGDDPLGRLETGPPVSGGPWRRETFVRRNHVGRTLLYSRSASAKVPHRGSLRSRERVPCQGTCAPRAVPRVIPTSCVCAARQIYGLYLGRLFDPHGFDSFTR